MANGLGSKKELSDEELQEIARDRVLRDPKHEWNQPAMKMDKNSLMLPPYPLTDIDKQVTREHDPTSEVRMEQLREKVKSGREGQRYPQIYRGEGVEPQPRIIEGIDYGEARRLRGEIQLDNLIPDLLPGIGDALAAKDAFDDPTLFTIGMAMLGIIPFGGDVVKTILKSTKETWKHGATGLGSGTSKIPEVFSEKTTTPKGFSEMIKTGKTDVGPLEKQKQKQIMGNLNNLEEKFTTGFAANLPKNVLKGSDGKPVIVFRGVKADSPKALESMSFGTSRTKPKDLKGKTKEQWVTATWTTTNPRLAGTYAGKGWGAATIPFGIRSIHPKTGNPIKIIEFKPSRLKEPKKFLDEPDWKMVQEGLLPANDMPDWEEFDNFVKNLGEGEVAVHRDTFDIGPYGAPEEAETLFGKRYFKTEGMWSDKSIKSGVESTPLFRKYLGGDV